MATQASPLVQSLLEHLQQIKNDPDQLPDERLLDECGVFLPPELENRPEENASIVGKVSVLLLTLQHDPTPLIRLLQKLVTPFTFSDILSLEPSVDFVNGLQPQAVPFNRIMLQLLRKAAATAAERASLANMQPVVKALVHLWLVTPEVGVAEDASSTLLALLEADCETNDVAMHGIGEGLRASSGQGLLWRRVFGDKDIYSLFYWACGPEAPRKERSLAQARLMALAPHLGKMDWSYLVKSHHPEVETKYSLDPSGEGLLDYIAVRMVDYQGDVLLHVNLMHFYRELITLVKLPSSEKHMSVSLHFLRQRGVHERTISYWLLPNNPNHDPLDLSFLYGPSAQYMSAFASECADAFLRDPNHRNVIQRLSRALSISAAQWAQGQSPKHDLNVLVSLPRVCLLPQTSLGIGRHSSPLLCLPCKNTNADALNSLASLLSGPSVIGDESTGSADEILIDGVSKSKKSEAAAARALYAFYLSFNANLFSELIEHANIVALPEKALAAIHVISSIANANWNGLPAENSFSESAAPMSISSLPSEAKLTSLLPGTARVPETTARSGIEALLQSPTREEVFPFLLRPPQVFAHLVGGRGDPESNAYKVALGKWDCLLLVHRKLSELAGKDQGDQSTQMLLSAITDRMRDGVWGAQSQAGSQIASLDL